MTSPPSRLTTYEHDGLVFDVRDEGPLDGEVVVALHGFPERASTWDAVAPLLHAEGLRTLAPDQRGYSPGARPRRRREHRLRTLAGDVAALVERAGGRAHLLGHDWGAAVAWALAATRPDLVTTLTAVSVPHPRAYAAAMLTSRQGAASWYTYLFQLPRLPERLMSGASGARRLARSGMTPAEVERFRREIVAYGALPGGLAWYRAMPLLDRRLMATRVVVPTTMLWSDGDHFIARPGVERCAAQVDGDYELVVLPGLSHWLPTHAPEEVARAAIRRIRTPVR